jgi:hypothetical protein
MTETDNDATYRQRLGTAARAGSMYGAQQGGAPQAPSHPRRKRQLPPLRQPAAGKGEGAQAITVSRRCPGSTVARHCA